MTTLEAKGRGVEENLGAVGERERAVAKVLSLLLVLEHLERLSLLDRRLFENLANDALSRVGADGVVEREEDVGDQSRLPLGDLKVARVDEVGGERGDVVDEGGLDVESRLGLDGADGDEDDGSREGGGLDLGRGEIGSISVSLSDFAERLDRLDDDATGLGVGDRVLDLDEAGKELGEEGANGELVVDELGHVVLRWANEDQLCARGNGERRRNAR